MPRIREVRCESLIGVTPGHLKTFQFRTLSKEYFILTMYLTLKRRIYVLTFNNECKEEKQVIYSKGLNTHFKIIIYKMNV